MVDSADLSSQFQVQATRPTPYLGGLCNAVAYVGPSQRSKSDTKVNIASIGGVLRLGSKYFALTAAHVFFDNADGTGSWIGKTRYSTNSLESDTTDTFTLHKVSSTYSVMMKSNDHSRIWLNDPRQRVSHSVRSQQPYFTDEVTTLLCSTRDYPGS